MLKIVRSVWVISLQEKYDEMGLGISYDDMFDFRLTVMFDFRLTVMFDFRPEPGLNLYPKQIRFVFGMDGFLLSCPPSYTWGIRALDELNS
jgi:hypothetical protein